MAQGSVARRPVGQQVPYLYRRLSGADGDGTFTIGWVPAGSTIIDILTGTRTAFSGGTPAATIGSRDTPDSLVAAAGTGLTTVGSTDLTVVTGAGQVPDVDTEIVVAVSGGPTDGVSDVIVIFIPPDEAPDPVV